MATALAVQSALAPVDIGSRSVSACISALAGQLGVSAAEPVGALQGLLDLALAHQAASWAVDYVYDVCASSLTSDNPVDAQLSDPVTLLAWVREAASSLRSQLVQAGSAPGGGQSCGGLQRSAVALQHVVAALQGTSISGEAELVSLAQQLEQTQQAARVLGWLDRAGSSLQGGPPHDHSGLPAWQRRLAAARQRLPVRRLYLDDLLASCGVADGGEPAYPFPSVREAVLQLFVHSAPAAPLAPRQALLAYYLLDARYLSSLQPLCDALGVPSASGAQWEAGWLLDVAEPARAAAAAQLDRTGALLQASAQPSTPFWFVEALLALGRPAAALAVYHARSVGGADGGLHEQSVMLQVRLQLGLLSEAHCDLRAHCASLPPAQRRQHVAALVSLMAEWAVAPDSDQHHQQQQQQGSAQHGLTRLQRVGRLPLDAAEEAALVAWIERRMERGQPEGSFLATFYLQRARYVEALQAHAAWQRCTGAGQAAAAGNAAGPGGHGEGSGGHVDQQAVQRLCEAAAQKLPPALTNMEVVEGADVLPLLQGLDLLPTPGMPIAHVTQRGAEPPAFLRPAWPNTLGRDASGAAAAGPAAAVDEVDGDMDLDQPAQAACVPTAESPASDSGAAGGLGWWASASQQPLATSSQGVPLLFTLPGEAGAGSMTQEDFAQQVLGVGKQVRPKRTPKRQKTAPAASLRP